MSLPVSVTFHLERETKGTYRYAEDGPPAGHKIGVLYVKKITTGRPVQHLLVKIEEVSE